MRSQALWVLSLMLVASWLTACGPGTCIDPQELTYKLMRDDKMVKDVRAKVVLDIVNKSEKYMLVDRVAGAHFLPGAPDSFLGPEPGALEALPDGAGYLYRMVAQQETEPLLTRGLVPPGARMRVELPILPRDEKGEFRVYYRGLTAEEVASHAYFPVVRKDGEVDISRFEPLSVESLAELSPTGDSDARPERFSLVVLSPALATGRANCSVDLPYTLSFY